MTIDKFNELVESHGAVLYRIACRLVSDKHLAEDIVQDTFRDAWKMRKNFKPGHDRAWLCVILRRRAADRRRKNELHAIFTAELAIPVIYEYRSQEFSRDIQQALDQLAAPLKETLLLIAVGELTHQEAAAVLKVPIGTILSRVNRARTQLRALLRTKIPA